MFAEPLNLRGVVREVISGISQKCFKRKLASGKFGLWEFLKGFAPPPRRKKKHEFRTKSREVP